METTHVKVTHARPCNSHSIVPLQLCITSLQCGLLIGQYPYHNVMIGQYPYHNVMMHDLVTMMIWLPCCHSKDAMETVSMHACM